MTRAILLFVGLLAGCAPQGREIALADVDLRNMQTVEVIRAQLAPEERIPFANYVVRHHARSDNFCGDPLMSASGKAPVNIGEAVDLSIVRDAAERQAVIEANKPKHPNQLAMEEWDRLTSARDVLMDTQSRLSMEFGDKAERLPEWKSTSSKMAEINKKLLAMKPVIFGVSAT